MQRRNIGIIALVTVTTSFFWFTPKNVVTQNNAPNIDQKLEDFTLRVNTHNLMLKNEAHVKYAFSLSKEISALKSRILDLESSINAKDKLILDQVSQLETSRKALETLRSTQAEHSDPGLDAVSDATLEAMDPIANFPVPTFRTPEEATTWSNRYDPETTEAKPKVVHLALGNRDMIVCTKIWNDKDKEYGETCFNLMELTER